MASESDLVIDLPSDEIEIKGDGSAAPSSDIVIADKAEVKSGALEPEDAIDAIKKDLDVALRRSEDAKRETAEQARLLTEERAAREKLQTELATSNDQAFGSRYRALTSELQQITNGLQSTQQALDAAEQDYQRAFEAGDAKAATSAQKRIAFAAADLRTMESGKAAAEQTVKDAENWWRGNQAKKKDVVAEPTAPKPQSADDWIDQVAKVFGGKPAEWLKKNRQFVTDPKLNQKLLKFADYYREVEEKPLDTDDFTRALNSKFLGEAMAEDEKPAAPVRKAPTASAPVSRSGEHFSSRNLDAGKIKLPAELVQFCKDSNLNPTKYALSCVELIKEGKLDKQWLDEGYDRKLR